MSEENTIREHHAFVLLLYERYNRFVYSEARKYSDYHIEAADLTQEVWFRLCNKAEKLMAYPPEGQMSYMATTVRNTAISLMRKTTDTFPLEVVYELSDDQAESLNDVLDRQFSQQHFLEVWPLVPQPARELLERKYLLGESDSEIAVTMQIKTKSVRMALTRARKTAFSALAQYKDLLL